MSNVSTKVFFESVAEQQEHIKNTRKSLKVLQGVATDKENLAGRPQIDKLSRLKAASTEATALASAEYAKRKKIETHTAETQTSPDKKSGTDSITADDLTSESPSEAYWERLAEKRRTALETTLDENRSLHERIEGLEEELNTSRQMLDEARSLVEVLTEMLKENEDEQEIKSEVTGEDEDSCDTRSNEPAVIEEEEEVANNEGDTQTQ